MRWAQVNDCQVFTKSKGVNSNEVLKVGDDFGGLLTAKVTHKGIFGYANNRTGRIGWGLTQIEEHYHIF